MFIIAIIWTVFLSLFIGSFINKERESYTQYIYFILGVLLITVAAFRPIGIDRDSLNYENLYRNNDSQLVELTFIWISNFVKRFFDDSRVLFVIYAILGVGIKLYAFPKLSKDLFLCLIVYLSNYYLLHDMTQIRAGVASGIFLLAMFYLASGKKIVYLLCTLIAILFHYSAIVLLPLIFLDNKPLSKRKRYLLISFVPFSYMIYFLNLNLVMILPVPYLQEKLEVYQRLNEKGILGDDINVFNVLFLIRVVVYLLLLYKYELISTYNRYSSLLLKVMGVSIVSFIVFYSLPVVSFRISEMLGIVDVILYVSIFYVFKPRYLSNIIVLFISLILLVINLYYNELIVPL